MGVGSFYGDIKHLPAEYVGGSDASGNHGGTGAVNSCIRALSAAEPEFHHTISAGSMDNAGGFCGDKALMVNDVQKGRFNELGLHNGGNDFY